MIIRFPTALYDSIIPQKPQDSGNVTFTISIEDPPRSSLLFSELPPAVSLRRRPPRSLDPETRREAVDGRLFTSLTASSSQVGSNKKIVEVGQVLEFTDVPITELEPMLVSNKNEFQHNTNLLELDALGISEQDIELINESANALLKSKNAELNKLVIDRRNIETSLVENRKSQNENAKALEAIRVLVESGQDTLQSVVEDLEEQAEQFAAAENDLITEANEVAEAARSKIDEIRELIQVVR